MSLLTPIHFSVPTLNFGPLVAKYWLENEVSSIFLKKNTLSAQFIWYLVINLGGESLDPYLFLCSYCQLRLCGPGEYCGDVWVGMLHMLWSKNRGRNYTLFKSLGKWGVKAKHWTSCWKNMGVDPIHPRRGILIKRERNATFIKLEGRNTTYFKLLEKYGGRSYTS